MNDISFTSIWFSRFLFIWLAEIITKEMPELPYKISIDAEKKIIFNKVLLYAIYINKSIGRINLY